MSFTCEKQEVELNYFNLVEKYPNFKMSTNLNLNRLVNFKTLLEGLESKYAVVNLNKLSISYDNSDTDISLLKNIDDQKYFLFIDTGQFQNPIYVRIMCPSYKKQPDIDFYLYTDNLNAEYDSLIHWCETCVDTIENILGKYNVAEHKPISLITADSDGLNLMEYNLSEKFDYTDIVSHNYNDDFQPISDTIIDKLTNDSKGIILLHGGVGTGKTMYTRYLCQLHSLKKKIIYLPPNMTDTLASPQFISFISTCKNSILLIEDAENVLMTREAGANQAVSNILNLTDGILSDCLNIQIIATFNSNLDKIDPALMRNGRLIAEYEFTNLTVKKANELIQRLYPESQHVVEVPTSLTNIYNLEKPAKKSVVKPKQKMGFG